MDRLDVRVVATSDDLAAKASEIRLTSARRITTPKRALFLGSAPLSEANFVPPGPGRGVVEVYRAIDRNMVRAIDGDNARQRDYMNRLVPPKMQASLEEELVLIVLRLFDRAKGRYWLPDATEIRYLADLLAALPTKVVVPPTLAGFTADEVLGYLRTFISRVQSNSSKPVIGLIPYQSSWRDQERVQEFYRREGLTSYVWDLHGRTPNGLGPNLRSLVSHLGLVSREHGPTFAHALNVKYSQERRAKPALPARDMLLLCEAFDSFGSAHIPPRLPEEVWKRMEENPVPPTVRLFSSEDYGYHSLAQRLISAELEKGLARAGRGSSASGLRYLAQDQRGLAKLVSAHRQAEEAVVLTKHIQRGTLSTHIGKKAAVSGEAEAIGELAGAFRRGADSSRLDAVI